MVIFQFSMLFMLIDKNFKENQELCILGFFMSKLYISLSTF